MDKIEFTNKEEEYIKISPNKFEAKGTFKMTDNSFEPFWVPEYTTSAWDMMHLETPQQKYKTTKELCAEWAHDTVRLFEEALEELKKHVYPTKIIYNPPYTICYFGDDKEIVKCSEFDEFKPDFGVMACIMRRMFSTRAEFDRLVESGSWQEPKEKKNK